MGFSFDISVSAITVFLQGILSVFSPCVLPILPVYIGCLSGRLGQQGIDGEARYGRKKVMAHTFCFVLGVSAAFFILGFGASALGQFFRGNQMLFARIGGVLIILIGLYQLGIFGNIKAFSKMRRLPVSINMLAMSPITAFLMGFTFSFAWTPCVGPVLASVLLMAASAGTQAGGFLLIGVYTLGFVLPFLIAGLFTTEILNFFKRHGDMMKVTDALVKVGAVLMIIVGILMCVGKMNSMSGYLADSSVTEVQESIAEASSAAKEESLTETAETQNETAEESTADPNVLPAIDFTLNDQYGNSHTLSDYVGQVVFLNFWGTWCPPCRRELPDIQKLYEEYSAEEKPEVVILGIAAPNYGQEGTEEEIRAFLEENGYTYPVVMDTTGEIFMRYGVYSFPTTFMIDTDGNVFGYVTGQLNETMMRSIIEQTVTGVRYSDGSNGGT